MSVWKRLFTNSNRRAAIAVCIIILTMLAGLLFGACGVSDVDLDMNLGVGALQSGGAMPVTSNNFPQITTLSNTVILFLSVAALVLAAGRKI